jgi:hypothetical protein
MLQYFVGSQIVAGLIELLITPVAKPFAGIEVMPGIDVAKTLSWIAIGKA